MSSSQTTEICRLCGSAQIVELRAVPLGISRGS